ncbi:MAG: glutamyl-tRNA reductase [Planctomycetota bacterium]
MLGCSFHQTAVDFRERLNFSGPELSDTLKAFRQEFPNSELVLLSTCNRTELYTSTAGSEALDREEVITFLARQQNLTAEELLDRLIYRSGASAVEHLFTVAASLDSMVIGEAQILSQVKQAYDRACTFGSAGPLTHSVFQAANRAAKRVQTETAIHRRRVSVPSVAVGEVIPDFFDSIDNKSVLVVGAGEMAEETLRYLRTAGARQITLLNRTFETAATMAAQFECRCDRFETLPDQLHTVDIVVTTTSAPNYIIEKIGLRRYRQAAKRANVVDSRSRRSS